MEQEMKNLLNKIWEKTQSNNKIRQGEKLAILKRLNEIRFFWDLAT